MKRKGISLIVLIITIVVIIILGTAIIVNIAKTNIINNANEAVLKSDVANLKSELEMYITDQFVATKGKYDREKLNADVGQAKYNEENIEDENKDGKTNIYDILTSLKKSSLDGAVYIGEGKLVFIRSKFNAAQLKVLAKMGEEIDGKPRITDITSESDFTSITVSAQVTNPEEVEKYIYILNDGEGIETTESSMTFEGLEPATKYTVKIKAVLNDGTEIEMIKEISTLDNTPPIEPIINSSYGYPLLTEYGVVDGGKTIITYDTSEGVINHYSLDNGVTWNEYKGAFYVNEACTIMAKSLKPNGLESSSSIEVTKVDNIIGSLAYDEDDTTYYEVTKSGTIKKYMGIDENMWGKTISIHMAFPRLNYATFYFLDSNGTRLETKLEFPYKDGATNATKTVVIPNGAVKMECEMYLHVMSGTNIKIHEIIIQNEPTFQIQKLYPILNESGIISGRSIVGIDYFPTSTQKLYKINDEDWKEYNSIINLDLDDIVYAKGIDKNGKETVKISSYESKLPDDAIGSLAYDEDDTTYYEVTKSGTIKKYMEVDKNMWGKTISIHMAFPRLNYATFYFLDSNGTRLETKLEFPYKDGATNATKTVVIPNDAVKMECEMYLHVMSGTNIKIHEICLK